MENPSGDEALHRLDARGRRGEGAGPLWIAGCGLAAHRARAVRRLLWFGVLLSGCGKGPALPVPTSADTGRTCFETYCAACHHPEGLGVKGGGPPLVASPWVAGPESRLIRIVLHGVRGPMAVGDQTYSLEMPGFGRILGDAQIAELLTFVRDRYGGSGSPITAAAVSRVRAATRGRDAYWSADELVEIR